MLNRLLLLIAALALSSAALAADDAELRRTLEPKLGVQIDGIEPGPVPGLYEVRYRSPQGVQVIYVDATGNYVIQGKIYDLRAERDLTEERLRKLNAVKFKRPFHLEVGDLNSGIEISNASVVMMVLTLQFIRPLYRERLVKSIWRGLADNGCLIVVEKVLGENSTFNRLFIKHYYEMKMRNGYSELEIAQKREALENVLVPYRLEENKELFRGAGFRHVDTFFKWYNFCGMIALK